MRLYRKVQEVKKMDDVKYHVFFRRVSTTGQDIAMQVAADAPYREKLLPEEIIVFEENAVSANKLSVKERPEMKKVISLIKQGKVHTVYAFDRTRLFRDSYEAQAFNDLRNKHSVQLFLTSTDSGNIQATEDVFLEGLLNIFSDIEGKNIARRTAEAWRMYPSKKLGYVKNAQTKQYTKDPNTKQHVEQFFSSMNELTTIEELVKNLTGFRKTLKKPNVKLIEMARDPFYAGYDLSRGKNKLRHVESYISLETFTGIQETKGEIFDAYLEQVSNLKGQNSYLPICGYCKKPLNYRIDEINNKSFYTCSRKHKKVIVSSVELADITRMVLHEVINQFDSKNLLKHSYLRFRELRNELESQLGILDTQLYVAMEKIVLEDDYTTDWKEYSQYQKTLLLKKEKVKLLGILSEKETLLQGNKEIVEVVKAYLHDYSSVNPAFIHSMFIKNLYIFRNEIEIEISKFDYLKKLDSVLIYKGDEIA